MNLRLKPILSLALTNCLRRIAMHKLFERKPMPHLIAVTRPGTPPETTRPDPATVIFGDPVHPTWPIGDRGTIFAGLWHSTPGIWRMSYDE